LMTFLGSALIPSKPRIATRPGRAAKERRLEYKHQRGTRKRERAGRDWE